MFAKECIFQVEPSTITILRKSTYRVTVELGSNTYQLELYTCLLDTCTEIDLVSKAILKKEGLANIKKCLLQCLHTAAKEPISLDGSILFVRIGDWRVRVWFGIVGNLAVEVLIGNLFIDRYIPGNLPSERKLVPRHSSPVPILSQNSCAAVQHHIREQDCKEIPVETICIARKTVVRPHTRKSCRLPHCSN